MTLDDLTNKDFRDLNNRMLALSLVVDNYKAVIEPDRYGFEKSLSNTFITDEMLNDFSMIARDFLKHEGANLALYRDESFDDDHPRNSNIQEFWSRTFLHAIYRGFRNGSGYCKALLRYLCKTYHKKIYKTVKRFNELTKSDIKDLCEIKSIDGMIADVDEQKLCVILCMAEVFDIKIQDECAVLYVYLNRLNEKLDQQEEIKPLTFSEETLRDCVSELENLYNGDEQLLLREIYAENKFLANVCRYLGYPESFILQEVEYYGEITNIWNMEKTLAILKMSYPKQTFTKREILLYSLIFNFISTIVDNASSAYEDTRAVLDLAERKIDEKRRILFDPSKIETVMGEKQQKQNNRRMEKKAPEDPDTQKSIQKEIDSLRQQLHNSEREKKELIRQIAEDQKKITEYEGLEKGREQVLQDAKKELAALRSHLYHLTEYDVPADSADIDSMTEDLKGKMVTIIGGHSNWTGKLKNIFPNWRFIAPNISASFSERWVDNADFVYFFTDTMSHSVYGVTIRNVRDKGIPFGYIHGVNIDANIKQMWQEVVQGS